MKFYNDVVELIIKGIAPEFFAIKEVKKSPCDVMKWIALAQYYENLLPDDVR